MIWRSKRPGRSSAGSRTSGRFVAAIITMPSVASKPSISASIWLSVCSRSSCPPPRPAPRLRPMESISSTKMIAGACLRAVWKRSRTRAAPTPTNISMKSEPVTETNGTPASPATARAMSVLPVPGGPTSSTPFGMRAPISLNLPGVLQEVDDLGDLLLHRAVAGDVGERRLRLLGVVDLRPAAPDVHHRAHLALRARRLIHTNKPTISRAAAPRAGCRRRCCCRCRRTSRSTSCSSSVVERRGGEVVLRARARELLLAVLTRLVELAVDLAGRLVELDALDVAVVDRLRELRVGELGLRRSCGSRGCSRGTRRRRGRARPTAPSAATATTRWACARPAGAGPGRPVASGSPSDGWAAGRSVRAGRRRVPGSGGGSRRRALRVGPVSVPGSRIGRAAAHRLAGLLVAARAGLG